MTTLYPTPQESTTQSDAEQRRARRAAYARAYYAAHREQRQAYMRQRYAAHPERARAYYLATADRQREYNHRWRTEHSEERRAYKRKWYAALRSQVFDLLGRECARCGATEDLTCDHVNGGGKADREAGYVGAKLYRHILTVSGVGFQVLCRSCNVEKYYHEEKPGLRQEATAAALAGADELSLRSNHGELSSVAQRATPGGGRNSKEVANFSRLPRTRRASDVSGSGVGAARVAVGAAGVLS